jgi:hypothetical protein
LIGTIDTYLIISEHVNCTQHTIRIQPDVV